MNITANVATLVVAGRMDTVGDMMKSINYQIREATQKSTLPVVSISHATCFYPDTFTITVIIYFQEEIKD